MKGILIGLVGLGCFMENAPVEACSVSEPTLSSIDGKREICVIERSSGNLNFVFYFTPTGQFLYAWRKWTHGAIVVSDHTGRKDFDLPCEEPGFPEATPEELEAKCDEYLSFISNLLKAIEGAEIGTIEQLLTIKHNVEFLRKSPSILCWIASQLSNKLKKTHGECRGFVSKMLRLFKRNGIDISGIVSAQVGSFI